MWGLLSTSQSPSIVDLPQSSGTSEPQDYTCLAWPGYSLVPAHRTPSEPVTRSLMFKASIMPPSWQLTSPPEMTLDLFVLLISTCCFKLKVLPTFILLPIGKGHSFPGSDSRLGNPYRGNRNNLSMELPTGNTRFLRILHAGKYPACLQSQAEAQGKPNPTSSFSCAGCFIYILTILILFVSSLAEAGMALGQGNSPVLDSPNMAQCS